MRRLAGFLALAAAFLVSGTAPAAEVGAMIRNDTVHLVGGDTVRGTVLMNGPRGVVIAAEAGGELERFIPAKKIVRVERAAEADAKGMRQTGNLVNRYVAEPREGGLQLAAEASEKAEEGGAEARRPKRSPLVDLDAVSEDKPRRPDRRRTILRTSRDLDKYKTRRSETRDKPRDKKEKVLDLFGGEDEDRTDDRETVRLVED